MELESNIDITLQKKKQNNTAAEYIMCSRIQNTKYGIFMDDDLFIIIIVIIIVRRVLILIVIVILHVVIRSLSIGSSCSIVVCTGL